MDAARRARQGGDGQGEQAGKAGRRRADRRRRGRGSQAGRATEDGHEQAGEARRGRADSGRGAGGGQAGRRRTTGTDERGQNNKRGEASRAMDMASITAGKTAVRMPIKGPRPRAQRKTGGTKTKTTPSTEQKKGSREKQRKTKRACSN